MAALEIYQFPCLSDNYGFLVHDSESGETACIDTPETAPILAALEKTGWTLTQIWNTHHHYDHAGNNEEIKRITRCTITGPAGEADKIPAIDRAVDDGDTVMLGVHEAHVLNVGGHTLGHIAFHMEGHAFVGDSLFALGCGRVFEGTMAQMWESLQKLDAPLPASNKPTVPTEIALERATNPFLRATDANVQARLNMSGAPAVDVFAEIRARKDSF